MITRGKIPFVRLLLPLMAGIICARSVSAMVPNAITLVNVALVGCILLFVVCYKTFKLYKAQWLPGLVIHIVLFTIGQQLTFLKDPRTSKFHFERQGGDAMLVTVASEPRFSAGVFRFEGQVKQVLHRGKGRGATGKLLVAVKTDGSGEGRFEYGELLLIPSTVAEIQPPLNPGEFDYRGFLANKQIYHQVFLEPGQVRKLKASLGNRVISYALSFRKRLVAYFNRYIHDPEAASIASTLILGYRADLSTEIIQAYSKTGTMHVLSVSGMHVGLVFIVLNAILKSFDRRKRLRFLKPALIIPLIWFYALITGFSPSVSRAALMLSFFVLGKSLNRSQNSYNLVAISAFFLLLYNPYYLFDVGFQLSYLAVLGLIYIYPKIYQLLYIKNWLGDQTWSYCALSIAAQLATFPLSVYYFHQFPVYFLVSNLFIVLPVTLIMYLGFLFLLIPVPFVSACLGPVLDSMIRFVNSGLYLIENAPFATIENIWLSNPQLLLLSVLIISAISAFQLRSKRLVLIALASLLLFLALANHRVLSSGNNKELLVYSLSKNTAISFINGRGGMIITDLSPNEKAYGYSVNPYLSLRGVTAPTVFHSTDTIVRISRRNFYQFAGFRLLRWDRSLNYKRFQYPISVDAVLLTGNPNVPLQKVAKEIKAGIILVDGNNSGYRVRKWQQEARSLGLRLYDLKKGAYHVSL